MLALLCSFSYLSLHQNCLKLQIRNLQIIVIRMIYKLLSFCFSVRRTLGFFSHVFEDHRYDLTFGGNF